MRTRIRPALALGSLLWALPWLLGAPAAPAAQPPDHLEAFPPFRIAGNLYYVGSKGLANFLITTPQGHILINSDWVENVPLIRASIEKLGFKYSDVKILLISHAHPDHAAGSAAIKAQTGATYMVMDRDVGVIESGGKTDPNLGSDSNDPQLYPPTKVDRILHDGEEVRLGGAVLVAHLTAGHTQGCTTWTLKVEEGGRSYDVVIVGSAAVYPDWSLTHNPHYPDAVADYAHSFRVLKSLPVDIFLGPHGGYFNLQGKYAQLQQGVAQPFVDPAGYAKYVADRERDFHAQLAKEARQPAP